MTDARATDVRAPGRVARVSFVAAYLGSFLLGALVFAFGGGVDPVVATWGNLAIVTVFAVRMLAIRFNWRTSALYREPKPPA